MSYTAIYKCNLCGQTIHGEKYDMSREELDRWFEKYMKEDVVLTMSPMFIPHDCDSLNVGLAQLSGFSFSGRVGKEEGI